MEKRNTRRGKRRRRRVNVLPYLLILAVVIAVLIFLFRWIFGKSNKTETTASVDTVTGINYLKDLEARDTDEIEAGFKADRLNEQKAAFEDGELDVWSFFNNDAVLMGDSRTEEFKNSGYVEDRRCLASIGDTVLAVDDHIDEISEIEPSYIIMQYGSNDMQDEQVFDSPETFFNVCMEKMDEIHEVSPNSIIFMEAILPAIEPELTNYPEHQDIPYWNQVIQQLCEDNGIPFIDSTSVAEEHQDLYEPDGLHFVSTFYPYWGANIAAEVLSYVG